MYEKIAWDHFEKTGDIQSFLEYRRLMELTNNIEKNVQGKGEVFNELDKDQGNSNKGNIL